MVGKIHPMLVATYAMDATFSFVIDGMNQEVRGTVEKDWIL
jgi:hypothetical protein